MEDKIRTFFLTIASSFIVFSTTSFANGINEDGSWQFKSANDRANDIASVALMEQKKAGGFGSPNVSYGGSTVSIGNITTYTDSNGNVTTQTNNNSGQSAQTNYTSTNSNNGVPSVGSTITLNGKN